MDPFHAVLNGHGAAVEGAVVDAPALHTLHRVAKLLQFGLLLFILLHLKIKPRLLFIHIEGVVAGIEFRMAVHDFNNPLGYLIEKIPVMGDGQHRTLKGLDIALQPFHAAQVQMVGRLVQEQNVGFFQQQTRQIDPRLFPAGKAVKGLCALLRRNGQAVAYLIHIHVHLISAAGLKPAE